MNYPLTLNGILQIQKMLLQKKTPQKQKKGAVVEEEIIVAKQLKPFKVEIKAAEETSKEISGEMKTSNALYVKTI